MACHPDPALVEGEGSSAFTGSFVRRSLPSSEAKGWTQNNNIVILEIWIFSKVRSVTVRSVTGGLLRKVDLNMFRIRYF